MESKAMATLMMAFALITSAQPDGQAWAAGEGQRSRQSITFQVKEE